MFLPLRLSDDDGAHFHPGECTIRQGIAFRQAPDHAAGPIPKIALDEIECVSDPEAGNGGVHRVLCGAAARVAEIHVPRCQLAMDPVERRRGQRQNLTLGSAVRTASPTPSAPNWPTSIPQRSAPIGVDRDEIGAMRRL